MSKDTPEQEKDLMSTIRFLSKVASQDMFRLRHLAAEVFETHALELYDDVTLKMEELIQATRAAEHSYDRFLEKRNEWASYWAEKKKVEVALAANEDKKK